MDARVVGQLRMEGGDEEPSLARQHRVAVDLGEHLDVGPRLLEPRRADEDGAQRLVAVPLRSISRSASKLCTWRPNALRRVRVVAEAEVVAVEDDHPGARAEDRAAELAHRLVEAVETASAGRSRSTRRRG